MRQKCLSSILLSILFYSTFEITAHGAEGGENFQAQVSGPTEFNFEVNDPHFRKIVASGGREGSIIGKHDKNPNVDIMYFDIYSFSLEN